MDPKLMLMCLLGVTFDVFRFIFFHVGLSNKGLASGGRLSFPLHTKCTGTDTKPSLA